LTRFLNHTGGGKGEEEEEEEEEEEDSAPKMTSYLRARVCVCTNERTKEMMCVNVNEATPIKQPRATKKKNKKRSQLTVVVSSKKSV
jgi:hypothetical protein